jgi:hypothetical protein
MMRERVASITANTTFSVWESVRWLQSQCLFDEAEFAL